MAHPDIPDKVDDKAHEQFHKIVITNLSFHAILLFACLLSLIYMCKRARKTEWPKETQEDREIGLFTLKACFIDQMWSFAEITIFAIFGIVLSCVVLYHQIDNWKVFILCSTLSALRYFFLLKILTQYAVNELINARSHVFMSKNLTLK